MSWPRARRRAKVFAYTHLCSGDPEPVADWVEAGSCQEAQDLRMLCLELVAKNLRTGLMTNEALLARLREIHGFAAVPDTPPARAVPVPRREGSAGQRRRTA